MGLFWNHSFLNSLYFSQFDFLILWIDDGLPYNSCKIIIKLTKNEANPQVAIVLLFLTKNRQIAKGVVVEDSKRDILFGELDEREWGGS